MFTKILIANRGEIACRIMRSAQRLGVRCVAVASEIDRSALHAQMADELVIIGGSSASESYLDMDKILNAAQKSGAQAIHPGYGFLSENAKFARKCHDLGLKFIGPCFDVIEKMGLKDTARAIMEKAGVPVVPGVHGENLTQGAKKIGFPVLVKAAAGGGGKGMRLVEKENEIEEAIAACAREAKSAFGNDSVFIEKYIETPRHIEVQIFGDASGNIVHLFERDCSIQRRHQKVIEEAPAPDLPEELRDKMHKAAITAGKALGYENAGTVEFIMDASGPATPQTPFYFMEINTRLQVEHPVTEMITGIDLVEWQLRISSGERLPVDQNKIKSIGHSFEIRLYAEDPARDFIPQTGRIDILSLPEEKNIRCDTGIKQGDDISSFYDPMLAKICSYGLDRAKAIKTMQKALGQMALMPIPTNHGFLARIFDHPAFINGDITTQFISKYSNDLFTSGLPKEPGPVLAALTAISVILNQDQGKEILGNWRLNTQYKAHMHFEFCGSDIRFKVEGSGLTYDIEYKDITIKIEFQDIKWPDVICVINQQPAHFRVWESTEHVLVNSKGYPYMFTKDVAAKKNICASGQEVIIAPMPGRITQVLAKNGETVKTGQAILRMEAMKIETTLNARRDGVIKQLCVAPDDIVDDGDVLASIEEEDQ